MALPRMLAILAGAVLVAAPATAQVVNVYNWSDYIDESILDEFTAETGIDVVYDVYDSNELLETKLLAGGSGYDVVVPSGSFLSRQIGAGIFQKLDKSRLTNLGNLWDVIQARTEGYDPGGAVFRELHVGDHRVSATTPDRSRSAWRTRQWIPGP